MSHKHTLDEHLDGVVTADTAQKLLASLGFSEREAQAALDLDEPSKDEMAASLHVNLHALAAAFSPSATTALTSDGKLDLGRPTAEVETEAGHVRLFSGIGDKLDELNARVHGGAVIEAGALQQLVYDVIPQIQSRARVDRSLRDTYAPLLAYHHARHPGHHRRAETAAATTPAPVKPTT